MIIHPEIRIAGFDARSWATLLALFTPDAAPPTSDDESGLLFVLESEEGEALLAHHSRLGRLRGIPSATSPATLRRLYRARLCVVVREGAIEELEQRTALRLSPTDDFVAQLLMAGQAARELMNAGLVRVDPKPPGLPLPGPAVLRRALDVLLPIGRSAVFCAWDGEAIETAACLHRAEGGIDALLGPRWLEVVVGPLGGDFRRDYRLVNDAVAERLSAPVVGLHAQTHTLHALLRSPDPGAWVAAVATRDLLVHPMPPYAAVALGADALRSFATRSGRALGGVDLVGALTPIGRALLDAVDMSTITATLGFDPLAALARFLGRDRGRDADEGDIEEGT